ncbi:uncharacterized protein BT62DRAFT_976782 [Guyanagaster necrorhizus]|uniref:Xylosidase/arabinosidase n=1 Tax=Guyanagaster necrorhizus TaxID=856835 RepID=A0A9P8ALD1_9AGAR|nr:uncharacterized protein BT62DRAFT_976782 [Guyanagaster necrorhizus MCA 3950]KAG7439521.1 hypothetical protein BT62DRAFT_976782 [Guyanagaster necrorhizus MCA 3950]
MHYERRIQKANPGTIQDKFLVGYQGWFTCGGDGEPVGEGHHGWLHWFNYPITDGGKPNIDVWPDVSTYSPSELFPAPGLKFQSGEQAFLFSSRHPKTVKRHFHWMAEHGVDGAFLQRFAGEVDIEGGAVGNLRIRDEVGDAVMRAAEEEGRVFAIMYDVTGAPPDRIQRILERDWTHLVREKGVLDSPNYLHEKGKPVIALWGFGFAEAGHTPALLRAITNSIRNLTPGGAYLMAGTPTHWRTSESDADPDPRFLDVWLNEFDAISPWTVGRYRSDEDIERFAETKMKGDMDLLKRHSENGGRKIDYIPVVLPGSTGFNLTEGRWTWNDMKRKGGRFLWKQIFHAKRLGIRTIYGAMWDEYDEGTAFMPIVSKKSMLPQSDKYRFMALDEDGYDLPPDWYMRICGFAAEGLRSERLIHETFPVKELEDYWSTRPKYEEDPEKKEVDGGQAYQAWLFTQKGQKDELPPPPYSLEVDEAGPSASGSGSGSTSRPVDVTVPAHASAQTGALNSSSNVLYGRPADTYPHSSYVGPSPSSFPSGSSLLYAGSPNVPHTMTSSSGSLHATSTHQSISTSSTYNDTISSLTNDFARQDISSSSPPPVTSSARPALSPPPLHPASTSANRPPQRPLQSQSSFSVTPPPVHPLIAKRPSSASVSRAESSSSRPPPLPAVETRPTSTASVRPSPSVNYQTRPPSRPQQQSSPQWSPPEWGTSPLGPRPESVPYPGYSRPSRPPGSPPRPFGRPPPLPRPPSPGSYRPPSPGSYRPPSPPVSFPSAMGPSYPPSPGSLPPPVMFPPPPPPQDLYRPTYAYPEPQLSPSSPTFPVQSNYPGQLNYPGQGQFSYPSYPSYPGQGQGYPGQSSFPGQFDQPPPGGYIYSQPQPQPQQGSGYYNNNALPPPGQPANSSTSSYLGSALTAVAGKKRGDQLMQSGSKLFNKFTK